MLRDKDYEFLKFAFLKEFILDSAHCVESNFCQHQTVLYDVSTCSKNIESCSYLYHGSRKNFYNNCMSRFECELYEALLKTLEAMGISSSSIFDVHKIKGTSIIDDILNRKYDKSKYKDCSLRK